MRAATEQRTEGARRERFSTAMRLTRLDVFIEARKKEREKEGREKRHAGDVEGPLGRSFCF